MFMECDKVNKKYRLRGSHAHMESTLLTESSLQVSFSSILKIHGSPSKWCTPLELVSHTHMLQSSITLS